MEQRYYSADDISTILLCSKSKAYVIIRELNLELKKKGFMTLQGRVSKKYFDQRFNFT